MTELNTSRVAATYLIRSHGVNEVPFFTNSKLFHRIRTNFSL